MYRVLIADDEPIERTVVCKTIQKYFAGQLETVQAVNGREAVQLFEERRGEIALLDIEMPGMNGREAAEKIRQNNCDCSIIFLTAFDEFGYAKRAITVHALDYLLKPGSDEELVAVLEEAISLADKRAARQADGHATGNMHTVHRENESCKADADSEEQEIVSERILSEKILVYIQENYMEDISLQDVAAVMNYSDAYFCKIFKHCFDKSFIVYLSEFRVEKAKQLLADLVINIKDISSSVGYRDSNYFTKVFKRIVGMTPSEYRMQILQQMRGMEITG